MVDVHVDADGLLVFIEMWLSEIDARPLHESDHRRRREDVVLELARAHFHSRDVGRGSSEAGCETVFHEKNIRESGGLAQHRAMHWEDIVCSVGLALDFHLLLLPFKFLARIILRRLKSVQTGNQS